ncbi:hypothetical protein IJV57_05020 [Candidatus Saccharibacteria bacterium]|nr:hypothetical protein [Candidatus Saccharibacteria bacterium]
MTLDIEGATTGYDSAGIASLLKVIHADVIKAASDKLKTDKVNLDTALDAIWQGKSELIFKNNLEEDVKKICKGLEDAYKTLESEVTQTGQQMGKVDENLVEKK